jgi:DNA-binding NarL/FixJ family response regulator
MADDDVIEVLLAEAHRLVRAGFRSLLEREADVIVVGEAHSGEAAVAAAERLRPDVVLIDAALPGLDAFEATRMIVEAGPARSGVLLLTASGSDAEVFAAVHAGAHGVLGRDSEPADMLRAVRVIAGGGALLTPGVTRRLAAEVVSRRAHVDAALCELDELTQREREVMALVGYGFSNSEIARQLAVSPATAKTHVGRAMAKLDARDRAELVRLAYETGLVAPVGQAEALPPRARRR